MKTNEKYGAYEAPRVEVIEVEVERGFQVSSELQYYDYGGNLSNSNQ